LNKLKTVFAVMLILMMSSEIPAAQEEQNRKQKAIQIRLGALEKTMTAYSYLNGKIKEMYQHPDSFDKKEIEKIARGFEMLADYSAKETETDPSDASYRENLDRFIGECKKNFSDMKMTDIPESATPSEPSPSTGKIPGTVSDKTYISDVGMKFVYIPPGTFMMGSPENEPGRFDGETQYRVTLTRGFYMQTTEVTQGQWKEVMGDNPSYFKECGDDCPVEMVSWDDAQKFIEKLNLDSARLPAGERLSAVGERSRTYRLPTEAEWEYAARAGSQTAYCFGDDAADLGKYAWYGESWDRGTHPVAQKEPNAWGLYDMHGNVWEWCQDWYSKYPLGDAIDPTGPESGSHRVYRGSSFFIPARHCRSALRGFWLLPGARGRDLGFRLVREAP